MGRPARLRVPAEGEYGELVAAKLDAVRRHRAISQALIAQVLGPTEATVSRWMTGKATPALWDLYRLTTMLDVPMSVIVDPDAGANDAVLAAISTDRERRREETERGSGSASTSGEARLRAVAQDDRTRRP